MSNKIDLIKSVFSAADCEIVGRIRLQKMFYLFEQLIPDDKFAFSYHHYGPYSSELSSVISMMIFDESIKEEAISNSFGGVYYKYSIVDTKTDSDPVAELSAEKSSEFAKRMKEETSVVIELAATIHWLKHHESINDWENELKARKANKATDERIKQALSLLSDLDMS